MGNYEYEPIKKLKENNKKKMFFMFLTVFMFLGISFATIYFVYRYNDERENKVVSGLVDVDFIEKSQNINLENTVPMTDAMGKENPAYVFTVENTSKIPINLKIGIEIGTNTIDLSAIKYALYINNEEIKVDNLENLDSENNLYIKEQFAAGAKIEVKLVFWIDYYYDTPDENPVQSFTGTIKVEGEQYDIYEETGVETIMKTIGKPGGVIGIKDDNTITTDRNTTVREYRYSGPEVNNYIYFNCNEGTTKETANANCEIWRIIGIFKDESGIEHLKIVRNNVLTRDMFPVEYKIGATTYKIQSPNTEDGGNYAYWTYITGTSSDINDWATAGIQYYLNTMQDETAETPNKGYLSYLKGDTLSMIENTKYYLGTFGYGSSGDTTLSSYEHERMTNCVDGIGPAENNSMSVIKENTTCRVWAGNKATWEGKVALMYPSDYGFSADSSYWKDMLLYRYGTEVINTSWLYKTGNHENFFEWFLSPSEGINLTACIYGVGIVGNHPPWYDFITVRPTLYLTSNVKITSGIGTQDSPYTLTME